MKLLLCQILVKCYHLAKGYFVTAEHALTSLERKVSCVHVAPLTVWKSLFTAAVNYKEHCRINAAATLNTAFYRWAFSLISVFKCLQYEWVLGNRQIFINVPHMFTKQPAVAQYVAAVWLSDKHSVNEQPTVETKYSFKRTRTHTFTNMPKGL